MHRYSNFFEGDLNLVQRIFYVVIDYLRRTSNKISLSLNRMKAEKSKDLINKLDVIFAKIKNPGKNDLG